MDSEKKYQRNQREKEEFADKLLSWYTENGRSLPWREEPTPYHVWISEIMLQQTRVEAVKKYYERFLSALPDIRSLSEVPEDRILKLWEGLGYYSRARNLKKGAAFVMSEFHGRMPANAEELRKIPGIGPYTSSAVASIAFGERIPAVDGNLLRIFSRLCCEERETKSEEMRKECFSYFLERMPERTEPGDKALPERGTAAAEADSLPDFRNGKEERKGQSHRVPDPLENPAGSFNQALMDLGAMICLPHGAPKCELCPFSGCCTAHQRGEETAYPKKAEKKARTAEDLTVLLIRDRETVLLHQRVKTGLLASLYEFPNLPGQLSRKEVLAACRDMGLSPLRIQRLDPARHIFTHKEWRMVGYRIDLDELTEQQYGEFFRADLKGLMEHYPIPSAFSAYRKPLTEEMKL